MILCSFEGLTLPFIIPYNIILQVRSQPNKRLRKNFKRNRNYVNIELGDC